MIENILYFILAIVGLGFLIFIHELGHYFMAKWVGMRVEVFSIGFGKPIFAWKRKNVSWQLGWLPFGGYVKIAGMEKVDKKDLHKIKDGYFGKKPIDRIKVSLMGPLMNILFAFLVCAGLWALGGRDQPFSRFSKRIGWVDTKSELYEKGVRCGDEITRYDNRVYHDFQDLIYSAAVKDKKIPIQGWKIDYYTNNKTAFNYTLPAYELESMPVAGFHSIGIIMPAQQLFYKKPEATALSGIFPLSNSQIQENDRILWADGEFIFSALQLNKLVTQSSSLLTIQRQKAIFTVKLPRVKIGDLQLSKFDREEIDDWRHENKMNIAFDQLYFIPYYFNENGVIETPIEIIENNDEKYFSEERNILSKPLQRGDKIIAVDGKKVESGFDVLQRIQKRNFFILVQRAKEKEEISCENVDSNLTEYYSAADVQKIVTSIGTDHPITTAKNLVLLPPLEIKLFQDYSLTESQKKELLTMRFGSKKIDKEKQEEFFTEYNKKYILDIPMQLEDQKVRYNPNPFTQIKEMCSQIGHMFTSLFTGKMKFQWLSGPIGIIQVIHQSWKNGGKEALSWMAFISLNLGFINLLPIPALDGGHIIFSFAEMIRRKPISIKVIEILSFIFFVLLFLGFIYLSYQDIYRLIKGFF